MDCWINERCIKPNSCDENCIMYKSLKGCIRNSNLPINYLYPKKLKAVNSDLNAFKQLKEILNNIQEFVTNGNSLIIYSAGCGNGKTSWATKLLLEYIFTIEDGNYLDCRAVFVNVVDFLMEVRMNREYDTDKSTVKELMSKIEQADLVVWDEIGVKQLTEYEKMFLYSLINKRVDNNKSNIYTSNTVLKIAEENLGFRLFSRIYSLSTQIEFNGGDWRDKEYRKMLGVED